MDVQSRMTISTVPTYMHRSCWRSKLACVVGKFTYTHLGSLSNIVVHRQNNEFLCHISRNSRNVLLLKTQIDWTTPQQTYKSMKQTMRYQTQLVLRTEAYACISSCFPRYSLQGQKKVSTITRLWYTYTTGTDSGFCKGRTWYDLSTHYNNGVAIATWQKTSCWESEGFSQRLEAH